MARRSSVDNLDNDRRQPILMALEALVSERRNCIGRQPWPVSRNSLFIELTARRNFARFGADLSEQHTCLNLNCRLRQRYPAALDAKVTRRSSALRLPAPASSTGPSDAPNAGISMRHRCTPPPNSPFERHQRRLSGRSQYRNLNRPTIGLQHHGLVARPHEVAAEFPHQLRLGVEVSTCAGISIGIPPRRFRSSSTGLTS
jgi:hypothetical protein